jgi:hypothetical protein
VLKDSWEYRPIARAYLAAAKQLQQIGSRLLVLAPLAQHFVGGDPLGLGQYLNVSMRFIGSAPNMNPRFKGAVGQEYYETCQPHAQPLSQHPDGALFLQAARDMDPLWGDHFGYLDLAALSAPWHDLHPESGSTGWVVDCTHYAFHPTMYDAIWADITAYLKNLKLNR